MTSPTTAPEGRCRAVDSLVRLLDEAAWRYDVQHATGIDLKNGTDLESLGVRGVKENRHVVGMWERPLTDDGKWRRAPGYIWGPVTGPGGLTIWIYLVKVAQAEMNAWVRDPAEWWSDWLPKRAEGTWGFTR